jgi:hypothetical protein
LPGPPICIYGDPSGENTEVYKIRVGRSLLLGFEVLVAADIVNDIAHELSFISLACSPDWSWCVPFSAGHWSWKSTVGARGSESRRLCHREFGLKKLSMHADESSAVMAHILALH